MHHHRDIGTRCGPEWVLNDRTLEPVPKTLSTGLWGFSISATSHVVYGQRLRRYHSRPSPPHITTYMQNLPTVNATPGNDVGSAQDDGIITAGLALTGMSLVTGSNSRWQNESPKPKQSYGPGDDPRSGRSSAHFAPKRSACR